VKATNADGDSTYSTTTNGAVTPAAGTQTSPGSPTVTCISYSKNQITWTDTNSSEDGYRIERKLGAGAWTFVANTLPNVVLYRDENLTADTGYVYRVRAYNIYYTSAWTSELNGTTWKPYLAKVTATNTIIQSSGSYSLRVERTASSPNPLVVNLASAVPGSTVPASVTIPANSRSVAFNILIASAPATEDRHEVSATADGFTQSLTINLRTPSAPTTISDFTATGGSGAIWLSWKNPSNYYARSLAVVRLMRRPLGGTFSYITPVSLINRSYVDSVPAGSYEYQATIVDVTGAIQSSSIVASATVISGSPTLTLSGIPSSATTGFYVDIQGATGEIHVFLDDMLYSQATRMSGGSALSWPRFYVDATKLTNGSHSIRVASMDSTIGTTSSTYVFSNAAAAPFVNTDGVVVPELGMFPSIQASLPAGTLQWTTTIRDHYGNVMRVYAGFGETVNIRWDGRNTLGSIVPVDRYTASVTADGTEVGYGDLVRADINPEFFALVMLPEGGGIGYNVCAGFADRIIESLNSRYSQYSLPSGVLVYTEKANVPEFVFRYTRYALKTARWVYLDGHSSTVSGPADGMSFGADRFIYHSSPIPGIKDQDIVIEQIRAERGFNFVWLFVDVCSTGGGSASGPLEFMGPNSDYRWGVSAGINTSLYEGGFMAWNGYSKFHFVVTLFGISESAWGRWRRIFMQRFIADGFWMNEAIYSAGQNCGYTLQMPYYPYSFANFSGVDRLKLVTAGEVYMPW